MHVVATAGHVDHGKSTLVRTLTGVDPDRLAEERRRRLTIELGYAWTRLPGGGEVAFVDVPGHERFVPTMLAGVGPVPAVLLVVAADDGWMPQTQEHVDALHGLNVRHGLLVVTRTDLADPAGAIATAHERLRSTSLSGLRPVAVSSRTGDGLPGLRAALTVLANELPVPAVDQDVRMWVDRVFTVAGAGTVVTGTLPAGTVSVGDRLSTGTREVVVRGLQTLGHEVGAVSGVARVAVRLGGRAGDEGLRRGDALMTPQRFILTDIADVRVDRAADLTRHVQLHIGASAVGCRTRRLGDGETVRLHLDARLPLRIGDRCLLRDPGTRSVQGATVLDPVPPALGRRGAGASRAAALAGSDGRPDAVDEVRRRRVVSRDLLTRIGVPPGESVTGVPGTDAAAVVEADGWVLAADTVAAEHRRLVEVVTRHHETRPLEPGPTVTEAARLLDLPPAVVRGLLVHPPLEAVEGRVVVAGRELLPEPVRRAVEAVMTELADRPFQAPAADRLDELGLTASALAAAHRSGALLRVADRVILPVGADLQAVTILARLPQPFTVSQASRALGSSRRVAVPLLQWLDRTGHTRRLPDDRRQVRPAPTGDAAHPPDADQSAGSSPRTYSA
ncbi:MAG TPA: selenocysteine-specific translation elongation factor [Nocardioidaceae bacterium]|jgi:selenocysteine-specific elongation factor|nr:selenocysteine-specific translation elongation factor [Nocardioidaceae bacterium]